MNRFIYVVILAISSVFFSKLGVADATKDRKRKKALWVNAGAFSIGFLIGILFCG